MAAPEIHQLSMGPLTGVAFGPDRSRQCLSTWHFVYPTDDGLQRSP